MNYNYTRAQLRHRENVKIFNDACILLGIFAIVSLFLRMM